MAIAVWWLVHGLAFSHRDGKFDPSPADAAADWVRAAVRAVLGQIS